MVLIKHNYNTSTIQEQSQYQPYSTWPHTPEQPQCVQPSTTVKEQTWHQPQLQPYETSNWYGQTFSALLDDTTTEPAQQTQQQHENKCPCQCEEVLTRFNALENEVMQLRWQQAERFQLNNGNEDSFNGMTKSDRAVCHDTNMCMEPTFTKEQLKKNVTGKTITECVKFLMHHLFTRQEMLTKSMTGQATAKCQAKDCLDNNLIRIIIDIVSSEHNVVEAYIKTKIRNRIKIMRQQAFVDNEIVTR